MGNDPKLPAGGQPSDVPEGDQTDGQGPVPYNRFQTVNSNWRETQQALAMKEQENQQLQSQLADVEARIKQLEAQGAMASSELAIEDDYVDPYLQQQISRSNAPLAQKVNQIDKSIQQINQFFQSESQRRGFEDAQRNLERHFSQRAQEGMPLSDVAKDTMSKLYFERVVSRGLTDVISIEDVENSALGIAQKMEFEQRRQQALKQAQGQGQPPPASNPSRNTQADLPQGDYAPDTSVDSNDPWQAIGTKPNWRNQFKQLYGNRRLSQDVQDFEEDVPFTDPQAID